MVEYSVSTAEQRRAMADAIATELEAGASVLGMHSVAARQAESEDIETTRVAVYFQGGEEAPGGGEAVAAAVAEPGADASSVVEEIEQMTEVYEEQ